MKCDACDHVAEGETFDAWCMALLPHYKEAHANIMSSPKLDQGAKAKWMAENKARFDAI